MLLAYDVWLYDYWEVFRSDSASLGKENPGFLKLISVAVSDPGSGAFLTRGCGMGKKSKSGFGMNIRDPGWTSRIIFLRAYKNIVGLKIPNS
jgi:hypothetical protein